MKNLTNRGFTLVELVIIMVILGVLAAIAVRRLGSSIESSEAAAEEAVIGSLRSAIEVWAMEKVVQTSTKSYPGNPLAALDANSRMELSGTTSADNASGGGSPWGFDQAVDKIYHLRNDGSYVDWDYNRFTGEIF